MPIKVLSASAGSGKTFNLSMFYIKLAMEDADNFKKILAITFTNAAVNEMKNRILIRLFELSKGKGIDEYRAYAAVNKNVSDKEIRQKAGEVLNRIVHHYYDFSVSTIDSFLQRFFRGALFEIGIRTNYELVVNNEEVIEQAVNDFLLNLDERQTAFKLLVEFIKNNVQDNKSFNYSKQLVQLTQEINKEFFYPYEKDFARLTEHDFKAFADALQTTIKSFIDKAKKFQQEFVNLCQNSGFDEEKFYFKSSGPASFLGSKLKKFIDEKGSISRFDLSNKYLNEALNDGKWVNKSLEAQFEPYKSSFQKLLTDFVSFLRTKGKQYEDAKIILEQLFNISILNLIVRNLHEYKKTNNIVLLSDIGKMLQGFIANNYLFIYEKLGIRYEYFLIDEFQDTSNMQYQVLKPLIENSISDKINESVLLVGDIKQAIYRWRNGDWKLMNETIYKDFDGNVRTQALDYNWRSYPYVIEFNNAALRNLVHMNDLYSSEDFDNSLLQNIVQNIYKDVEQRIPESNKVRDFNGYVKLILMKSKSKKNEEHEEKNETAENNDDLRWIADEVSRLWNAGYKNIGIIVRRNSEGSLIFDYLMNHVKIDDTDFKIISKESITYINSNAVLWIVFTLYYIQNNSLYAFYMAKSFFNKLTSSADAESFFVDLINNDAFKTKNLYYKVEYLINSLYQEINQREKTFCIHFLQLLKKYLDTNPTGEAMFIEWFLEKGIHESIRISGEKKGIHLVTIHKSKGLEYDAVIVPFVNWTKTKSTDYLWLQKPMWINNTSIPAFLVKKNKNLLFSNFEQQYLQEQNNLKIDDINLLYVAFTRAKKVLIAGIEQENIGKEISKLLETNFKIVGLEKDISMFKTIENDKIAVYELGELKNNDEQYSESESEQLEIKLSPKSVNLNLVVKGNEALSSQKSIAHGVLVHAIMEQINDIDNWKKVAQKIMSAFNVTEQNKQRINESIEQIFQKHEQIKHWFNKAKKIISERKIIYQGKLYRPDKIFIHNDKVILVDFKTGETKLEQYISQIKRYKMMLIALNYSNIESYL
ncbi:MAG: UvrD-helicase domain-containing protein, partial [Bacteroidales bacterium]